ncbi:tetratricopeptide repeat protein [Aerosakkonemataceae cyanobacterium BLCC-F154]|uniref:Tetratricopeptide repeat protein n=1 Tax=Floridaenema fluviatile BLCC-F154 TaxID=3153640 RepID=A0ABV4Y607_9CYAN
MKNHLFLTKLAVLGMTLFPVDATAQPKLQLVSLTVTSPQIIAQNLSDRERRELQILRQERQSVQQEKQSIQREKEIRNLVQAEVDRAFNRTTSLINFLLFAIVLFPLSLGLALWWLRRSIKNQLIAEVKQELETEVAQQAATFKQEITQLQGEYVSYFSQLQAWANSHSGIADNYVSETPENTHFINSENHHFIPGETHTLMAQDQEEISSIDPNELTVTSELDNSQTQDLTIEYYVNLGNTYLAKSRYQDAIDAYNAALKIERNSPEIRYQNAKAYALRGSINPALGNLQWAIDLDPQYKEIAQTDPAFDYIRNDEQFQQLIND